MSEKIGGAKGTELDDEFLEKERVTFYSFFYSMVFFKIICDVAGQNELSGGNTAYFCGY